MTWVVNQVVYFSGGGALRTMVKDILAAIDAEIACLKQAKTLLSTSGEVVAKGKEAPQDERGSAGAYPAGTDQAMGRVEHIQDKHERRCRAAAKGQEEDCKDGLIAFSSENNRFRNQIQRHAARKSRERSSIILTRYVRECGSTRNCLADGHILRAAARSGNVRNADL